MLLSGVFTYVRCSAALWSLGRYIIIYNNISNMEYIILVGTYYISPFTYSFFVQLLLNNNSNSIISFVCAFIYLYVYY